MLTALPKATTRAAQRHAAARRRAAAINNVIIIDVKRAIIIDVKRRKFCRCKNIAIVSSMQSVDTLVGVKNIAIVSEKLLLIAIQAFGACFLTT